MTSTSEAVPDPRNCTITNGGKLEAWPDIKRIGNPGNGEYRTSNEVALQDTRRRVGSCSKVLSSAGSSDALRGIGDHPIKVLNTKATHGFPVSYPNWFWYEQLSLIRSKGNEQDDTPAKWKRKV